MGRFAADGLRLTRRGSRGSLSPVAAALVIAILLTFPALGAAEPSETASDSGSLMAAHGEIGRFFNPWEQTPKRRGWGFLRWKLLSRNPYDKKRPPVIPRIPNDGANLSGVAPSPALTWVGHATYAIHDGDDVVLTDPHFGERALIRAAARPAGDSRWRRFRRTPSR